MADQGSARHTRRLLAAPDKFRGTLTAPEVVQAVAAAARECGWECTGLPLADGGEGLLDAFGGANRESEVAGPDGGPVAAPWRLGDDGVAVIESALASGLALAGGPEHNDPMTASSTGTGQLVVAAVRAGAREILVGLGGSAMSDGGWGAVEAVLTGLGGSVADQGVRLSVACDVQTAFADAARVFGPQKGADDRQVDELSAALTELQRHYLDVFGVDLADLPGGGAAGGLGGGLVVLGGQLLPGLDLVADHVGLDAAMDGVDLVVTGEGALDAESFHGKVVGGVVQRARRHGIPVLVVTGTQRPDTPAHEVADLSVIDLSVAYGSTASWRRTAEVLTLAVRHHLRHRPS